jgi:hypothetical protein
MKITGCMNRCSPEYFWPALLIWIGAGCGAPSAQDTGRLKDLSGTSWISRSYLDALDRAGTPARVKDQKCLELVFSAECDSLILIEGLRNTGVYPVKPVSDTAFVAAGMKEEGTFVYPSDGRTLRFLHDTSVVAFTPLSPRYLVGRAAGWRSGAELFFNERLMAARYFLLNPDNEPTTGVVFSAYGEVAGLANYRKYRLCLDPSCFAGGEDVIELSDGATSDQFVWDWQNDTLRFYNIRVPVSGNRQRGQEIFRFVKQR